MASRLTTLIVVSIVAATLIAGIIARAQRDDDGPVDVIVFNGKVYAGGGRSAFAEAIAVRGNTIFRVGSNREIKRMRRPQTTVIDAHGGAVVPGFNDSHVHFASGGLSLSEVNLLDATTAEEIAVKVRDWADAHADRRWVLGRGWYYTAFPDGLPTRQMLDEIVPDRPAYLTVYDGHSGWANTAALKLAGITRATVNPKNGVVVKDAKGEPTGVLKESAMALVRDVLPKPERAQRLTAIRAGDPGGASPRRHERPERKRQRRRDRSLGRAPPRRRPQAADVSLAFRGSGLQRSRRRPLRGDTPRTCR